MNVVKSLESFDSGTCQNPEFVSSHLSAELHLYLLLAMGVFLHHILFRGFRSRQMQTEPESFAIATHSRLALLLEQLQQTTFPCTVSLV